MFKDKKILVIVPHQDDETNIAGGFISRFSKDNDIFILYTTNGDYIYNAKTRISECYKSCKVLGVDEKRIMFLGYSDQYSDGEDHLYMTDGLWVSKNGFSKTYMPFGKEEVSKKYRNKHNEFNRQNFVADIELVIEKILPDILVCIDFDSHCDHRATSLAFERALGIILNRKKSYAPLVYKGFAYPTAYFGEKDFDLINIKSTRFSPEPYSYSSKENPYYINENPVRFGLEKDCREKRLWKNRIFKALKLHRSQAICEKAKSIINGDQLYYQRRTDNLLNKAKIAVSSGEPSRLHDFVLFECEDIMKGNSSSPTLIDYAWVPKEEKPYIDISFEAMMNISGIQLYNSVNSSKKVEFDLLVDGEYYDHYAFEDELIDKITFLDNIKCKKISLLFNNVGFDLSLSELEIFEYKEKKNREIVAMIDGDIVYDYYFDKDFKLSILSYDGIAQNELDVGECDFFIEGKKVEYSELINGNLRRKNSIDIKLKTESTIKTNFVLIKKTRIDVIANKILAIINSVYVSAISFSQKVNRKLFVEKSNQKANNEK